MQRLFLMGAVIFMFACCSCVAIDQDVYKGEMVAYPGPWSFQLGRASVILVSDKDLEDLSDPDKVLNLSCSFDKYEDSLRGVCEKAHASGCRTLIVAFDQFFGQYRPGQEAPRKLTPDMDEYVNRIAAVSKFASQYGLGLELSLLSPLEISTAYTSKTGESGRWMQYSKGLRDPVTGSFSVEFWLQKRWVNNKGPVSIKESGFRVFAFTETPIENGMYRVVDASSIVEITDNAKIEYLDSGDNPVRRRVRIFGAGRTSIGKLDRVFIVQQYQTPEMDYFSPKASEFLHNLVDKYTDAGVKLNALYSDEMHIQQDWDYFGHHDNGEFTMRYVSPGFEKKFAQLYGAEYADFAKYLIYFVYGQESFSSTLDAKSGVMHVFGPTPEDVRRTALFRSRYYKLLQDGVVDLFVDAKKYAENLLGHKLEARAHATWAESPTIDYWQTAARDTWSSKYEYTSNFVWSCTVHQASAACSDYFKWGDYLTGNGNDHAECGWLDRDYLGMALACSTGILNDIPYSYAAHWGSPGAINRLRYALIDAYGVAGSALHGIVQNMQHRDVQVLMLYPIDLVSVEERFGSWITQYGYANYVTQTKLLERGKIVDGAIEMGGRRFTTLVATFEPFPSLNLLKMIGELVESGGRVVWSGPPPVLTSEGTSALDEWQRIFGVVYTPGGMEGIIAPGARVEFEGILEKVQPQIVLTDMLVDRLYPVTTKKGTVSAARAKGLLVGTYLSSSKGGSATFLGYRPRDDQSASLGYETRNWFEVMNALGAYPESSKPGKTNDNTEYVSRTTDYLACRFPNGAISIAPHLRTIVEDWPGGFGRNQKEDEEYLKRCPPPSGKTTLKSFYVNGHKVTYYGEMAVTFRVNENKELFAFSGTSCSSIIIDGKKYTFADKPMSRIAWAPVEQDRQVENGAVMQMMVEGTATINIPASGLTGSVSMFTEGSTPGSKGTPILCKIEKGNLTFQSTPAISNRWIYVVRN